MTELTQQEHNVPGQGPLALNFGEVQQMIGECLGLDAVEIVPEARFFEDLGGESIDLLELSFQFEKAFHLRAPFKALMNKELLERDEAGELTPTARELIQSHFPNLGLESRAAALHTADPRSLLTVEFMYQVLVHAKSV